MHNSTFKRNRERTSNEILHEADIAARYSWWANGAKAQAIAPVLDELVKFRAKELLNSFEDNSVMSEALRKEILDILAIRFDDLRYVHKHFWSVFKWLFSVSLILIALPFLKSVFVVEINTSYLPVLVALSLPCISAIFALLSLVVTKIESTDVQRKILSIRVLLNALNERYDDFPKDFFTKQSAFFYLVKYESVNMIIWAFLLIIAIALLETVYFGIIVYGNFLFMIPFVVIICVVLIALIYFSVKKRKETANIPSS